MGAAPGRRLQPVTRPFTILAEGLAFPEGPVARPDGSLLLGEVAAGRVVRLDATGHVSTVATPGGGPGGLGIGPDGAIYACNGGGSRFRELDGLLQPWGASSEYAGGRIERIDPTTGTVTVLYAACDGHPLSSPNDLVFDRHGGFWFTDLGKTHPRHRDRGGVYYARADGSAITEAAFPMETPNGIGLSPDGRTLYVAETLTARLWAFEVISPGVLRLADSRWAKGRLLCGLPGLVGLDSLAVQANGDICVATLLQGGITRVSPDGARVEHIPLPDTYVTNLCFGGADRRTAFVTLSSRRQLVAVPWDAEGLALHHADL